MRNKIKILMLTKWDANPYFDSLTIHLEKLGLDISRKKRTFFSPKIKIWHIHGELYSWREKKNIIISLYAFLRNLCLMIASKLIGRKIVWTIHDLFSGPQSFESIRNYLFKVFLSFSTLISDAIIVHSISAIDEFPASLRDSLRKKITVLRLPIDNTWKPSTYTDLGLDEIPKNKIILLLFGDFRPNKSPLSFLKDFIILNNDRFHLVIAGRIKDENILSFINEGQYTNITTINRFILECEKSALFEKADFVVIHYARITTSGLLTDAVFKKKPCIVTDLPYFKEMIGSEAAIYCQYDEINSLRDALRRAETLSHKERNHMVNLVYNKSKSYTWSAYAKGHRKIYSDLIASPTID